MQTDNTKPTATERYFFDNNGYLVLERFLEKDHVAQLLEGTPQGHRQAATA